MNASTPEATIAEVLRDLDEHIYPDAYAENVVSALEADGYVIVRPVGIVYGPCWKNEHGIHPLNSATAWRPGAEADVERLRADDPEIFLGVHYRTPWIAVSSSSEVKS